MCLKFQETIASARATASIIHPRSGRVPQKQQPSKSRMIFPPSACAKSAARSLTISSTRSKWKSIYGGATRKPPESALRWKTGQGLPPSVGGSGNEALVPKSTCRRALKGHNSVAGGSAPGTGRGTFPTLKGSHYLLPQGGTRQRESTLAGSHLLWGAFRGRCPRLLYRSPPGIILRRRILTDSALGRAPLAPTITSGSGGLVE
jgi:hypothetical protein